GAAPRIPAPWGRGRLLRALQRHGYRIAADPAGRHVLIGPGGVFLLESRAARNAVSRADGGWRIGDRPAERVVDRLAAAAVRVERALVRTARARGLPESAVVPVIVVSGRLPEPVMRADRAVIARPRAVLRFILDRPEELDPAEVDALTAAARRALAPGCGPRPAAPRRRRARRGGRGQGGAAGRGADSAGLLPYRGAAAPAGSGERCGRCVHPCGENS